MTGRRFVTAAAVLPILVLLGAAPAPALELRGEPGAVVFATEGVRLAAGAVVAAGDVVVNGAADDRADAARGLLVVAPGARVPEGSVLKGDRLIVRPGARVGARLVCNALVDNGAGDGGACADGLDLPVTRELPGFRRGLSVPGRPRVRTEPGAVATLAPGVYQGLHARRGSTVRLAPGVYHVGALVVSRGARLVTLGTVEIRVARRFHLGSDAVVGPANPDEQGPVLHVGGEDRDATEDRPRRSAVATGARSTLAASVYAPFGTVHLGPRSQARGLFLGRRVLVGRDAVVVTAPAPGAGTPGGPGDPPPGLPDQDPPGGDPGNDPPAGGDPDDPSEPPPDLDDPSEPPPDDLPDDPDDPDDAPDQDRPPAGVEAFDLAEETFVDVAVTLTLLGDVPGTHPLRFAVTRIPGHGTLGPVVPGPEAPVRSAIVTFTPDPGFQGSDAFELQACATVDGEEACDGATARLEVREPSCLVDPRFCDDGR